MTRFRRLRNAYSFIRSMARDYPQHFERTKSREVARTYGLLDSSGEPESGLVRRMKKRFRCELSFGGSEGK